MQYEYSNLGDRILQAARIAAAVHLNQVAESSMSMSRGQRVVIGGAGPQVVAKSVHVGASAVTDCSRDGKLLAGGGRDVGVEAEIPSDAPSRPLKDDVVGKNPSLPSSICFAEGAD